METKNEMMLFDLTFLQGQPLLESKQLYNTVVKALGGFASKPQNYDDIFELDLLLRQIDAIRGELLKMKKAREERVVSEDNPLLTEEEVAQILRVSPETVRNEIKAGKFPSTKVGPRGQERILKSDVEKYLGVKKIIFTIKDATND
jgi:excisionase family DNA binding protein